MSVAMHTQGHRGVLLGTLVVDTDIHGCVACICALGLCVQVSLGPRSRPQVLLCLRFTPDDRISLIDSASMLCHRCYASGRYDE